MTKLYEGMRRGDLEGMVLPLVSVDEYTSKVDDAAIVIGFFIRDPEAAQDLNRFIQKSHVGILNSDVSPAPDQHGFYMVFVDFVNSENFVDELESILAEVSYLVGSEDWKYRSRLRDGVQEWDANELAKIAGEIEEENAEKAKEAEAAEAAANKLAIKGAEIDAKEEEVEKTMDSFDRLLTGVDKLRGMSDKLKSRSMAENIEEFFAGSALLETVMVGKDVYLTGTRGERVTGSVVAMGETDKILERTELDPNKAKVRCVEDIALPAVLGAGWGVMSFKDHMLLYSEDSGMSIILGNPLVHLR